MMTEERIGFLCNLSSLLTNQNENYKILRSYYLMRCSELSHGYGHPNKHWSKSVRCPKCCLEWTRETKVNLRSIKYDNKIANHKNDSNKLKPKAERKLLPHCNEMEQICSFCKNCSITQLEKPVREYIKLKSTQKDNIISTIQTESYDTIKYKMKGNNLYGDKMNKKQKKANMKIKETKNSKVETTKSSMVNVYSNAFDVFSLKNEKNTIKSSVKAPTKVIKNNKKKKDKFAGLCQKAVLASMKVKNEKEMQPKTMHDKLNLFLKPSSG